MGGTGPVQTESTKLRRKRQKIEKINDGEGLGGNSWGDTRGDIVQRQKERERGDFFLLFGEKEGGNSFFFSFEHERANCFSFSLNPTSLHGREPTLESTAGLVALDDL